MSKLSIRMVITVISLASLIGCDSLKQDPDVITPDTQITGKEVYMAGNTTSIIDLNTKVKTNLPVRLSVTSQPNEGSLISLGKGFLQYKPTQKNKRVRDFFEFTVYSESDKILQIDTIVIVVEPDSTQLPCGIFLGDDIVYNPPKDSVATINVLNNDRICGIDSLDFTMSILTGFGLAYGSATVVNNKIVYTPGISFTGTDKLIYKIQPHTSTMPPSYGFVFIQTQTQDCSFLPINDVFSIQYGLAEINYVSLDLLQNDVLCDMSLSSYNITIVNYPVYGTVSVIPNGIIYRTDSLLEGTVSDSLRYELCLHNTCRRASVKLNVSPRK